MMNVMIKAQSKIFRTMERIFLRHPYINFVAMVTVMPVLILIAVSVFATAIMLPMSWLCGWL